MVVTSHVGTSSENYLMKLAITCSCNHDSFLIGETGALCRRSTLQQRELGRDTKSSETSATVLLAARGQTLSCCVYLFFSLPNSLSVFHVACRSPYSVKSVISVFLIHAFFSPSPVICYCYTPAFIRII